MRHTKISSEPQSQPLRSVCQAEVSAPQLLGPKDKGPDAESELLFTPSTGGAPDTARRVSEHKGCPAKWAQLRPWHQISPGISLEGTMLKLKLQYFGHLMRRVDSLVRTDAGRDWGQEEKGTTEDEMAGWHHQLDGRESE